MMDRYTKGLSGRRDALHISIQPVLSLGKFVHEPARDTGYH